MLHLSTSQFAHLSHRALGQTLNSHRTYVSLTRSNQYGFLSKDCPGKVKAYATISKSIVDSVFILVT